MFSKEETTPTLHYSQTPKLIKSEIMNSFCVDMEDWFHISGVHNYSNPKSWDVAFKSVVRDTDKLLELFTDYDLKVTFLVLGWVAKKYPDLIRKISNLGHEVGCHGFYHRLVHQLTPKEFELDVRVTLELLRKLTGQKVETFRAPSFSITKDSLWAFPILSKLGIKNDISIVPAKRNEGGISDFPRNPFLLKTPYEDLKIIPVSVMDFGGITSQFSGGGFLRFLPKSLINLGFKQNHKHERSVMSFIHPREINPLHPKIKSDLLKYLRLYAGTTTVEKKLRVLFETYQFDTVSRCYKNANLPKFKIDRNNELRKIS